MVPCPSASFKAVEVAQDFEAFYSSRPAETVQETIDLQIISRDNKGIVMRPEGLREGTKKAAESEERKLKTRLSKGEKRKENGGSSHCLRR